jgi:hypothetical protein
MKIRSEEPKLFHADNELTDRHDEASSRILQFGERA